MTVVFVLIGGAAGAVVRYLTDRTVQARITASALGAGVFPWGTLVVNVAAALLLGVISGLAVGTTGLPGWARSLAGTGFCGALSTYSTFGYETVQLARSGAAGYAWLNAAGTLLAGLAAAALGWFIAS